MPSTDAAAKGVALGDRITDIDGRPVSGLSRSEVNALLGGEVGAKHALTFAATASPSLDHQTISVAVEDLLPLP